MAGAEFQFGGAMGRGPIRFIPPGGEAGLLDILDIPAEWSGITGMPFIPPAIMFGTEFIRDCWKARSRAWSSAFCPDLAKGVDGGGRSGPCRAA